MLHKTDLYFDLLLLIQEVDALRQAPQLQSNSQIGLTHRLNVDDKWNDAVGSLYHKAPNGAFYDKDGGIAEKAEDVVKIKLEEDFTELNSSLRGTYIEQVYDKITEVYGPLGRCRVMILKPRNQLSWHRDAEHRIHVPLLTNDGSFLTYKDINDEYVSKHMSADGYAWEFHAGDCYHTAVNSGRDERVHLLFDLIC